MVQYLQYPDPGRAEDGQPRRRLARRLRQGPAAPPHHFRGKDKITIHEDTDGDGVFDRHKTFVDGLNIATSVARGRGGVWVLNPPYLLFYPDREQRRRARRRPRGPPPGLRPGGHALGRQQPALGPGRLALRRPGIDGHRPRDPPGPRRTARSRCTRWASSSGAIIPRRAGTRSSPRAAATRSASRSTPRDGSTPDTTAATRAGFHYVQGGYYQKGFNKHGPLSNPYAFGYFPAMKHNRVPRFTHTFVIYEADALPERYRGLLFGVAPLLNHVVMSEVRPDGSSFQTHDIGLAVSTTRPLVPAGGHQARPRRRALHRRLVRSPGQPLPQPRGPDRPGQRADLPAQGARQAPRRPRPVDLARLTTPELVKRLADPNKWTRQTALRLIGDRKDAVDRAGAEVA